MKPLLHGEHNAPGEARGRGLARVQVSGDLFPEHGDALARIGAAVTGLPASTGTAAITASIRAAPGGDAAALPGICPSAVAAVRRAVLGAGD